LLTLEPPRVLVELPTVDCEPCSAGSLAMRGVPLEVAVPVDAPPLVVALPQPGREAVEVPGAVPVPPAVLLGAEPCVWICGGSGLDWPGTGAAGLPVTWLGELGLVGLVVPAVPGALVAPLAAEPAAPPVPPDAPPDDPPPPPPEPCAKATPLLSSSATTTDAVSRFVILPLPIFRFVCWWPTPASERSSGETNSLRGACYDAVLGEITMLPMTGWRRVLGRLALVALTGLTLTACDKCGNSIIRGDAGPLACKDERPR
jgi:hypothetical protein